MIEHEGNSLSHEAQRDEPPSPMRRRILDFLLVGSSLAWLGSLIYPVIRYLLPVAGHAIEEKSVKLGKLEEIEQKNGLLFRIGNKPGILIRTETGELQAFIAVCTHLDCTVQFKADEGVIWCACHNGRYNLQGTNISGPPPRPLTPLEVRLKGDEVHVSLRG